MSEVLEEIVGLIEGRLSVLREEEAELQRALKALKGEAPPEKAQTPLKPSRKAKPKRQAAKKPPRKTVADMIEEIMLERPNHMWYSTELAPKIGCSPPACTQALKRGKRFKFMGYLEGSGGGGHQARLYMLEKEWEKLPIEQQKKYVIPSVQGSDPMPSKSGREVDPLVYETAEGDQVPVS